MLDATAALLATGASPAIGAIGLDIVTGYAGQVSLGHAFFLGDRRLHGGGAVRRPGRPLLGFGITEMLIWLPAAGLVAALAGVLVAPLAARLRGLYLAIVTLGLVFIGEHIFSDWTAITGGRASAARPRCRCCSASESRSTAPSLHEGPEAVPADARPAGHLRPAARNLARSRVGRAFTAIRDRDIAAGVIGVNLARYKTIAFAVSSFYAGCAGALLYVTRLHRAGSFNLRCRCSTSPWC